MPDAADDILVVAFSQSSCEASVGAVNEVELIMPQVQAVCAQVGIGNAQDVDFVCSGSCDYLQGASFAFVAGVDALGAVPPIVESHVEMDAAWALYEAVLKLRGGQAESALLYGFAKASSGDLPAVLSQQLDPYYLAPLWLDSVSLAALQARLLLDRGLIERQEMAEVVARSRRNATGNARALLSGYVFADEVLAQAERIAPLSPWDCAPVADGASAMIICSRRQADAWGVPGAVISGIDHRIESSQLGFRDLTDSPSTREAARQAGWRGEALDIVELYAPFSHQEILLCRALGLDDHTAINPSGGVLAGHLMMASGLSRIGEVFERIVSGQARRGLAHATAGPCLQHNLVALLEAA